MLSASGSPVALIPTFVVLLEETTSSLGAFAFTIIANLAAGPGGTIPKLPPVTLNHEFLFATGVKNISAEDEALFNETISPKASACVFGSRYGYMTPHQLFGPAQSFASQRSDTPLGPTGPVDPVDPVAPVVPVGP